MQITFARAYFLINRRDIESLTCHTGSVCLPVLTVDAKIGRLILFRTSYTRTVPSYRPTASRLLCCGWKSRHMTPDSVVKVYSG